MDLLLITQRQAVAVDEEWAAGRGMVEKQDVVLIKWALDHRTDVCL